MTQFDPDRPDFASYGLTCVHWIPSRMPRPDHHNEIELNLVQKGWLSYLLGGQKIHLRAGQLGAFWASIPHQIIDFAKGTDYFVVTIPLVWFLQRRLPERLVQLLMRGGLALEDEEPLVDFDRALFSRWETDLKETGPAAKGMRDIVMLEMEARLRRMAANLVEGGRPGRTDRGSPFCLQEGGLNKVEQMACHVARQYAEPLTVADIGKAVGLHPNYAMNLFKKAFGMTLLDFLIHHRVSHAQRMLITSDEKIVDIALDAGFNSISRFNEAFRRSCGCTPREYRAHHGITQNNRGAPLL
ncbi:MAG: helix-turn-helix domain-containing protein [Opitutaceae bacterium]|jgi:AraC-like DNA-binding protein|nr:helix-turn-helix domain-containing protein [Opitutaceae bacterium]